MTAALAVELVSLILASDLPARALELAVSLARAVGAGKEQLTAAGVAADLIADVERRHREIEEAESEENAAAAISAATWAGRHRV